MDCYWLIGSQVSRTWSLITTGFVLRIGNFSKSDSNNNDKNNFLSAWGPFRKSTYTCYIVTCRPTYILNTVMSTCRKEESWETRTLEDAGPACETDSAIIKRVYTKTAHEPKRPTRRAKMAHSQVQNGPHGCPKRPTRVSKTDHRPKLQRLIYFVGPPATLWCRHTCISGQHFTMV